MNLSDMVTHEELLDQELQDPAFRAEWERTALARAVAEQVVRFRAHERLSQKALGELLGMKQPQVARLEAGEHTPSLDTLIRLAAVLNIEFNIDIRPRGRRSRLMTKRAQADASVVSYAHDDICVTLSAV